MVLNSFAGGESAFGIIESETYNTLSIYRVLVVNKSRDKNIYRVIVFEQAVFRELLD